MKKAATIALLALAASQVEGACGTNWIATAGGFSNSATVTGDTTFATCASIRGGGSNCCAATEVAKIPTYLTSLATRLTTAAGARDQFILDARGDVLSVADSLGQIQDAITSLTAQTGVSYGDLATFMTAYTDSIETFTDSFATLKTNFITYMKDRATCIDALVQAQATIFCAACVEDITTVGFDAANAGSETIAYGTAFTTHIVNNCKTYVSDSVQQSINLSLYWVKDTLATLASALTKLADGDATGAATDIASFVTAYGKVSAGTTSKDKVAYDIGTCTTGGCTWMTTSLFAKGILDEDLVIIGGSETASRRLEEIPAGRRLATLDADPATEAYGIDANFSDNPGSVDNDQNSAVRNGVVACAITALVALF